MDGGPEDMFVRGLWGDIISPPLRSSTTWWSLQHLLPIPSAPKTRASQWEGESRYMWACLGARESFAEIQLWKKGQRERSSGGGGRFILIIDVGAADCNWWNSALRKSLSQDEDQSWGKRRIHQEVDCTVNLMFSYISHYIIRVSCNKAGGFQVLQVKCDKWVRDVVICHISLTNG